MNEESIQLLQAAISDCISGPSGDPDNHHLCTAARITVVLQKAGVEVDQDYIDVLQGQNMEEYDYLGEINDFL